MNEQHAQQIICYKLNTVRTVFRLHKLRSIPIDSNEVRQPRKLKINFYLGAQTIFTRYFHEYFRIVHKRTCYTS